MASLELATSSKKPPVAKENHDDHWLETYTGKKISICNPDPSLIVWDDIVHALSMICRFGGHARRFISVAEHSILVSHLVPKNRKLALLGLLHDAPEAYLGDVIRPLKAHLPDYKKLEQKWAETISIWFADHTGIKIDLANLPGEVKDADLTALHFESMDLLAPGLRDEWRKIIPEHLRIDGRGSRGWEIQGLPFELAFAAFQERFEELME